MQPSMSVPYRLARRLVRAAARALPRSSRAVPSFASAACVLSLLVLVAAPGASAEEAVPDDEVGAADGLVVVAHPDLLMRSIDGEEIRRLFLGQSRRLPNGARAELASYGPAASFFNERVLELSDAQVATVWSRLRFSGRTPPPEVFDTADAVVDFVAATPNAIAYVPSSTPRDGVRVFYSVPR